MAECSYARCVQERRAIKKELQRWTKNMVFVVGLERIAEELMGRRKWKQYQETVANCPKSVDGDSSVPDWEPPNKCSLCDGVPLPDAALIQLSDSESTDSSSSSSSNSQSSFCETPPVTLREAHHKFPAPNSSSLDTMTTLESVTSMAASLAAVAALTSSANHTLIDANSIGPTTALPFYPPPHGTPMFPPWYLPPSSPHPTGPIPTLAEAMRLDGASLSKPCVAAPVSMSLPRTPGPDQPLDLSAKATADNNNSQQSLKVPNTDNKHIFKAKPRLSALSGRRTYTEEELQAALRDIQSGKLGTRRAAVIYGIPRSTLRNKVYKLAMEREREIHLVPADVLKADDEEKELSGAEEEQEVEKVLRKPLLSMEDLVRFSVLENSSIPPPDALRALLQCQEDGDGSISPPSLYSSFPRDGWGGMEHSTLGPYISHLLTASTLGGRLVTRDGSPVDTPKFPNPLLPEIVRRMMAEEKLLLGEQLKKHGNTDPNLNPNGAHYQNEDRKKLKTEVNEGILQEEEEEEKVMDMESSTTASGTATPPNVILKIPSFKPTSKNGVASGGSGSTEALFSEQFPPSNGNFSPGITQESSQPMSSSNSCSPPITNLMGKGIGVSLRDVIAKSISQKFQQGTESISPLSHSQQKFLTPNGFDHSPFSRSDFISPLTSASSSVSGSVIKNHYNNNNSSIHGDRNVQRVPSSHNKPPVSSGATAGTTTTGGKGTRPKRGKYRNYDRDSLVEAVRAVQRGEMSVHRAGSYYGVPHSTLEYKVKERHLMRPRKREPKVQLDEGKRKDDILRITSPEKSKLQSKPVKPSFPATSPLTNTQNGMVKMPPLFDPNLPLAYPATPPFPFWPSSPFHSLPIPEFSHGVGPTTSFGSTSEQFFASQMMQRLQEDSSRIHHSSTSPGATSSRNTPPPSVPTRTLGKNAREIAESLYDGSGTNGSFLDGIIRSSLEMGLPVSMPRSSGTCSESVMAPENMSNKALLDQLCRNSRLPPLSHPPFDGSSSDDDSLKRVCRDKCRKTDPAVGTISVTDLCSLTTNSPTIPSKTPVDEDTNKCATVSLPVGNTKNSLIDSVENLKPPSTGIDGVNNDECGTANDESACDSKLSVLRVDSNNSAKEEIQGAETEEKTKSKMVNSSRD